MATVRIQRRIERLLDLAEEAADREDWDGAARCARKVLAVDAPLFNGSPAVWAHSEPTPLSQAAPERPSQPGSFARGHHGVLKFLGEGGDAHDQLLARGISFSLIQTGGLHEVGRERIMRAARATRRPHHRHAVDVGEHEEQPYLVQEQMGGAVEDLLATAKGALPLSNVLRLDIEVSWHAARNTGPRSEVHPETGPTRRGRCAFRSAVFLASCTKRAGVPT